MKKVFAIALAASMIAGVAQAQEAFKHLGISVEAGTTGVGANISYPIVTDHLIITLGYNLPTFALTKEASLGAGGINAKIDEANAMIKRYNDIISTIPDTKYSPLTAIDHVGDLSADVEAEINFVNYKALLEYYPTTKSNFHFTAGVFVGDGDWINVTATANAEAWAVYEQARKVNAMIPESVPGHPDIHQIKGLDDCVTFNVDGQTIQLRPESKGVMKSKLTVEKVKPYAGIGFGSTIPKKHLGFQMELGAYCQGTPTLVSSDPSTIIMSTYDTSAKCDDNLDDIMKTVKKLNWYPQLTFRITGRLF